MDDVRRIADERQPLADEAPGDLEAERKGLDARGEADRSELRGEAEFKLADEILGLELEERAGVGAALVPDDARPAAGQRQDGERAGRQEMLLRPAFVLALVLDGGDDAGLVIVPAERGNVGQRAELRARPVRRCRQTRPQASAVGKRKRRSVPAWRPVGDRSHNARHAEPVAERRQRRDDIVDEGHVGERVGRRGRRNGDAAAAPRRAPLRP